MLLLSGDNKHHKCCTIKMVFEALLSIEFQTTRRIRSRGQLKDPGQDKNH